MEEDNKKKMPSVCLELIYIYIYISILIKKNLNDFIVFNNYNFFINYITFYLI